MDKKNFSKDVERLVDPISVGSLHFIQSFNKLLPKFVQKSLVKTSSKKTPYMGFVVEPYSLFLCYEIADLNKAKTLLPSGFELIKTKVFASDKPTYYCIFGCFKAHTSAFWGSRVELYAIAKDTNTGLLSWIILDYDTDTISYDTKHGLCSPNSSQSVITINHRGKLYVDFKRNNNGRKLLLSANIEDGKMASLDQKLWLEGNLSIGYGSNFSESADVFSLKFEPLEVEKALKIPINSLDLQLNTWYPGLLKDQPTQVVCFPYAQHFVSDSPGHASNLKNKQELEEAISKIDFSKINVFSVESFKLMFLFGSIASFIITITLLVLLIIK